MAYTFGGATTHLIDFTALPTAPMNTNRVGLVCCWVRPTTLTANRALWGIGSACGLVVGGTTSQVVLVMDAATTDSNHTVAAGLTVNTWSFVAILWNQGAATVRAARAWVGSETSPPVELTATSTSTPVGAWTGSGTTFTTGNGTAGSLSFQGDAGGYAVAVDSQNSNLNSICGIAAAGAITNDQAAAVLATFVAPAWRGDVSSFSGMGRQVYGSTQLGFALAASLDGEVAGAWSIRGSSNPVRGTVSGATVSARRCPHSFLDQVTNPMSKVRRGFLTKAS